MTRLKINTVPILAASFFALAASANASDLLDGVLDQSADQPVHTSADWTGLHFGVFGGWAWADWDGPFSYDDAKKYPAITFDGSSQNIGDEDWFGGIGFGADKQFGNVVLGGVIDVAYGDLSSTERFVPYPVGLDPDNKGNPVWDATTEIEYFGTARLRAGYLVQPSLLAYATGGLAWAMVESSVNSIHDVGKVTESASFASADENHIGWTVGGGLEWKLTESVSLVGEYLYIDLGEVDYRYSGDHATDNFHPDLELQIIKAGLNYRF
jgi:outer membrane immunogenic protein